MANSPSDGAKSGNSRCNIIRKRIDNGPYLGGVPPSSCGDLTASRPSASQVDKEDKDDMRRRKEEAHSHVRNRHLQQEEQNHQKDIGVYINDSNVTTVSINNPSTDPLSDDHQLNNVNKSTTNLSGQLPPRPEFSVRLDQNETRDKNNERCHEVVIDVGQDVNHLDRNGGGSVDGPRKNGLSMNISSPVTLVEISSGCTATSTGVQTPTPTTGTHMHPSAATPVGDRQNRFKVVKIVSKEPFKRGRWLCMDFTDPPVSCPGEPLNSAVTPSGRPLDSTPSNPSAMSNMSTNSSVITPLGENHLEEIQASCAVDAGTSMNLTAEVSAPVVQSEHENATIVVPISGKEATPPQTTITTCQASTHGPINNHNVVGTNVQQPQQQQQQNQPNQQHEQQEQMLTNSEKSVNVNQTAPEPFSSISQCSEVPVSNVTQQQQQNRDQPQQYQMKQQQQQDPGIRASSSSFDPSKLVASVSNSQPILVTSFSETKEQESVASSGGSTVAIDNKIEQAMDLVKSHLMFAVREEVDVLKERITELMEKIKQLEQENNILRNHASQETLGLLNQKQNGQFPSQHQQVSQQSAATVISNNSSEVQGNEVEMDQPVSSSNANGSVQDHQQQVS